MLCLFERVITHQPVEHLLKFRTMLSIVSLAVLAAGPVLPDPVPAAIYRHVPDRIQYAQETLANRPRWVRLHNSHPLKPLPKSLLGLTSPISNAIPTGHRPTESTHVSASAV